MGTSRKKKPATNQARATVNLRDTTGSHDSSVVMTSHTNISWTHRVTGCPSSPGARGMPLILSRTKRSSSPKRMGSVGR